MGTNDQQNVLPQDEINQIVQAKKEAELARRSIEDEVCAFNHDIRSATANILRMAYMLRRSLSKATEDQKNYLRLIEGSVKRLSKLNEALRANRALLKLEITHITPTAIFKLLQEQYPGSNIKWKFDDSFEVKADQDKLIANVLSNLLDNALTYSGEKPQVTVSVKKRGSEAVFCVADNGPGIPKRKRNIVCTLGQGSRLNQDIPGTGIGLYQAKESVKAMDGLLWIGDSKEGCKVYFSLPVAMNYVEFASS